MDGSIVTELQAEGMTPFHTAMLAHCRKLTDMSRRQMRIYYDKWDLYDEVYRGYRTLDKDDKEALDRKEPNKTIVPVTYSQIQTFVSFCYSVYTQREYFYELSTNKPEGYDASEKAESLLQRDLSRGRFSTVLYQFLLDVARFGLGVFKNSWIEEHQKKKVQQQQPVIQMFGGPIETPKGAPSDQMQDMISFQGNRVMNISPYRFFPDPRMPIKRFQEGEFVASEDEYGWQALKDLEAQGVVAGVDRVAQNAKTNNADRDWRRFPNTIVKDDASLSQPIGSVGGSVIVTEVQINIIPAKFDVNGKPWGPENFPIKYLVWYANDNRIIRCEQLNYPSKRFTYEVAEFNPDQHHFLNAGLAETIANLQTMISWFINSHVTSVRKTIQNHLVVDPEGMEMKDIQERRPVFRLKPGKSSTGVDRWIKQLNVQDVTAGHMKDAESLEQLVQLTTGINDNALGQYFSGRRSATEARNVSSGAASRLKMQAALIWYSCLEPLGRQMLDNLQDGLTQATYVRVFGQNADPTAYGNLVKIDPQDLVGEYDFEVFDGTLQSDKQYVAQTLEEILQTMLQNPEVIQIVGLDPRKMLYEIMRLKGVKTPEHFEIQQQPPVPPGQPPIVPGKQAPANTPVLSSNEQPQPTTGLGNLGLSQLVAQGPSGGYQGAT